MCCSNCGPSKYSVEHTRRYKPQNNRGCGCGGNKSGNCDTPSLALEGSPLYEWEKIHGKLVTTVSLVQNEWGQTVQIVEKKPCPKIEKTKNSCCSLRYKVRR